MRKSYIKRFYLLLPVLLISLTIVSCSSTKKIKYFQDIPDSGQLKPIAAANYTEPIIQPDDILTIIVQTIDPSATQTINSGNISSSNSGTLVGSSSQVAFGYLVNKEGFVEISIFGKIKVAGYTTSQASAIITELASKYYKEPTVIVRYANFRINITGEVLKPGSYIMPNEKVTILDAIAAAGDLTIYGRRENVLLIRSNPDGTKMPYRINLKKSNIISSPYYYLRQNDVIYVEPGTGKAAATDAAQARYYTLVGSLLSVLIVFFTRR